MVTGRGHFWRASLGAAALLANVHAKDLAAYRVGDTAEQDLTTPVALEVIDPVATAARRDEERLKTPAIFRRYSGQADQTIRDFTAKFGAARTSFNAALKKNFGAITNAAEVAVAPEFTNLVTQFNGKNPALPVPLRLARLWAAGDAGQEVQNQIANQLRQVLRRPIRPEALPAGFQTGDTWRLVTVGSVSAPLTLDEAESRGKIFTAASLGVLAKMRGNLRNEFSEDEQPLARAVAMLIKPDCIPDENLTQQARAQASRQLVVVNHYDAGQLIVRRGAVLDARAVAALAQLNEKLMPGQLNSQLAAQRELVRQQEDLARREHAEARRSRAREIELRSQAVADRARYEWLLVALAGLAAAALVPLWWLARRRRHQSLLPARIAASPALAPVVFPEVLPPQIVASLKEAVVQGLASQRAELLLAQQAAAREIAELVRRLDDLKVPMQERLKSYEARVQELENDLAERNQENRELLRLKIEMLNEKIQAERRAGRAVNFN